MKTPKHIHKTAPNTKAEGLYLPKRALAFFKNPGCLSAAVLPETANTLFPPVAIRDNRPKKQMAWDKLEAQPAQANHAQLEPYDLVNPLLDQALTMFARPFQIEIEEVSSFEIDQFETSASGCTGRKPMPFFAYRL